MNSVDPDRDGMAHHELPYLECLLFALYSMNS